MGWINGALKVKRGLGAKTWIQGQRLETQAKIISGGHDLLRTVVPGITMIPTYVARQYLLRYLRTCIGYFSKTEQRSKELN